MRLICPNCGAQYEVPDEVIPETGRDVQCSNCGDTWFQDHPDHAVEHKTQKESVAERDWDAPQKDKTAEIEPDSPSEPETEPEKEASEEQKFSNIPRRELDPAITDLLREEAAREESARRTDASGGIETQPDLGLGGQSAETGGHSGQDDSSRTQPRAQPDVAEDNDAVSSDEEIDPNSRRNLLPDIEEINSSLSSDANRNDGYILNDEMEEIEVAASKKSGFRRGFMLSVTLILILVLIYLLAPTIAQTVPALEGPLSVFVEMMNGFRAQLNLLFSGVFDWINAMASPPPS
ncbi:hypothetical protein PEL8287_00913 [Roseovarius litorisediminis]|uniref:Zinc finger/thioredoxin putative domain-containing protein n=1 Tax=Roseovarius litorisediminis TaxID=1312363 RepID=A0A1Y5RSA6_9RHOB|nr:zinc-ribbon domain-containing protein [Roseovarius litorisediminis]SLN21402.1 hypothetical protein PEL8287_00913 [Roseovarius litorisediminis]